MKRQNPGAHSAASSLRFVYALYGLTSAEIKLVEESSHR